MRFYTIGMQGFEIEAFLDALAAAEVGLVLDVRSIACSSSRFGFPGMMLRRRLSDAGISYLHVAKAGPSHSYGDCLSQFDAYLQANRAILWDLLSYIRRASERGQTVCLACNRKIAAECHRSVLVDALLKMDPALSVTNLPVVPDIPLIPSIGISAIARSRI
jgi:uncharacterized protein (DUF488 family)